MVNTDNQNCATNVDALRAVIKFIQRFNPAQILVGEGSSLLGEKETFVGFQNYGYLELKKEFPKLAFYDFNQDLENNELVKLININREEVDTKISKKILEDWYRISLTKPKTHALAIVTLSMKNMMGCIVGHDKIKMHGLLPGDSVNKYASSEKQTEIYKIFPQNVLRLVKAVPPSLSVIDGFEAMEGNGPLFGEMVNLGVAVASSDYVAADAIMSEVVGFDPMNIGYIYYANKEGLGCGDVSKIEIIGSKIEEVKIKLKPHQNTNDMMKWKISEWYP